MSLKTYIPKSIESEIERVRQGGSQISPSYFTTSLTRPTALSRNLQEVVSDVSFDLAVAPLRLPTTHSTGDVNNSRSFDYDYLIANETDTSDKHFFITDVGSKAWFITFSEEVDESVFRFNIDQTYDSAPNLGLERLNYKLLNTSNIVDNLTSVVDSSSLIKGYGINYLDVDYKVSVTLTASVLTLTTDRNLSPTEKQSLKDINIVVAFKDDLYTSNIKVFNKLNYNPTLNDYYIYNSTERFESLKTFLETRNVNSYDALAGSLENREGLMLSVDVSYDSSEDFTNNLSGISGALGTSNVILADNAYSLTGFQTLFYKVPDDNTSTILSVNILRATFNEATRTYDTEVLQSENTSTNPVTWYNFFKEFGITATIITKAVDANTDILKGFVLKVDRSLAVENEIHLVQIAANSTSTSTLGGSEVVTCLESSLEVSKESVEVFPSIESTDGKVKTFSIGYKNPLNNLKSSFSVELTDNSEDFTVYKSVANTLDKSDYTLTSSVNLSFESSDFFNLGYGVFENLQNLQSFLTGTTGVLVAADERYAELIVNNSNPIVHNLYLKTNKDYKLGTASSNYLATPRELLFQVSESAVIEQSFRDVERLPYIVVDMHNLKEIEVSPFSYLTSNNTLLKEQDKAYISMGDIEPPEDSFERGLYFKNILTSFSSSLLSLNLLPIVPLLDLEGTFSDCFAIFYDPTTIEGRSLRNTFIKLSSSSLLDSYSGVQLKYQSGVANSTPVFQNVVLPQRTVLDDDSYFQLYSQTSANIYGSSVQYSFNIEDYDVEFEVLDYLGESLEIVEFKSNPSENLTTQVANLTSSFLTITYTSENTDTVTVNLNSSVTEPRYSLRIKNTAGGNIVASKFVHYISDTTCIIPLNKV